MAGDTDGLAGDGGRGRSAWSTHATVSASLEQTLNGTGARVYTAHRAWLGVVTGISVVLTGGVQDWGLSSSATSTGVFLV